jgi:selT/selW/selH-like putative selenoprotein
LAHQLLDQYKNRLEQVALIPSMGGAFEVEVNGEAVFSKIETGRFPSETAVIMDIGKKL